MRTYGDATIRFRPVIFRERLPQLAHEDRERGAEITVAPNRGV
jgi:hypothetical protein